MNPSHPASGRPASGRMVVAMIVLLGFCLAGFAFWYQWRQTRRCLDFLGADVAEAVNHAGRVELWRLAPGSEPRRLVVSERRDVTRARGLVHLRHALVEDASFIWSPLPPAAGSGDRPVIGWTLAIAFYPGKDAPDPAAVLSFDAGHGWMTVVGRPGRIRLGRLGAGLARWVELVTQSPDSAAAP